MECHSTCALDIRREDDPKPVLIPAQYLERRSNLQFGQNLGDWHSEPGPDGSSILDDTNACGPLLSHGSRRDQDRDRQQGTARAVERYSGHGPDMMQVAYR